MITIVEMIEEEVGPINNEYIQRDQAIMRREDGSDLVDGLLPFVDLQQQIDLMDGRRIDKVLIQPPQE